MKTGLQERKFAGEDLGGFKNEKKNFSGNDGSSYGIFHGGMWKQQRR